MIVHAEPDLTPLDRELGLKVLNKLHTAYPGWSWIVDVPPGQNVVIVRNATCDPRGRMGFVIYKDRLYGDPQLLKVMRAGGEFLERYRMRRAAYRPEFVEGRNMHLEKPNT